MANGKLLTVIREQYGANAALQNVHAVREDIAGIVEQELLYPYFQYRAKCSVPTLIGRQELSIDCLVDGINGHGATADPFLTDQRTVPDEYLLRAEISKDEAAKIAKRTVIHQLGKKTRMIAPFEVSLEVAGLIYRNFWIVRIGDSRIMIDSVTGNMHPLTASAA